MISYANLLFELASKAAVLLSRLLNFSGFDSLIILTLYATHLHN